MRRRSIQGQRTKLEAGRYLPLVALKVRGTAQHTTPASRPLSREAVAGDPVFRRSKGKKRKDLSPHANDTLRLRQRPRLLCLGGPGLKFLGPWSMRQRPHTRPLHSDVSAKWLGRKVLTLGGPGGTRRSTTHFASLKTSFKGCCSGRLISRRS